MGDGAGRSWDVFISYATPDEATADQLYQFLTQRHGLDVYFHPESADAGDEWRADIPQHILGSAVTAVLLSEHSGTAWYQDSEVARAINAVRYHQRRVVPIRLTADLDLPFGLERVQAVPAWNATGFAAAVDRIVAVLDRPDEHENPLRRPIVSDRIPHVTRWFTGRDDLLDQLVDVWQEGGSRVLSQVQSINGMGGVGKSTVAAVLAERVRVDADVVWWLRSDQETSLIDDVIELADRLGIGKLDDRRERARQTIRFLSESDLRWLLVLDNVDDEHLVAPWVPRSDRGLSLVTTRDRTFQQLGPTIDVGVLSSELATDFLVDRVGDSDAQAAADRDGAAMVADLVQGLPLALEQAGAWVAASSLNTWEKFADRFNDAAKNPFPDGTEPVGYELTTWASIQVSIDAASERSRLAERLWHVLGWLAPNDIPIEWLTAIADGEYFHADTDAVEQAIVALERYSLLALDGRKIDEVHRVVHAAAGRSAGQESGAVAVRVLARIAPTDAQNPATWRSLESVRPHAVAAVRARAGGSAIAGELWSVLNACAGGTQFAGDPLSAIELFDLSLAFIAASRSPFDEEVLTAKHNLAFALSDGGRLDDALALEQEVHAARVTRLGGTHQLTLTTKNSLAESYRLAGRPREAVALLREVVDAADRAFRGDSRRALLSRANLALALWSAGELEEAIDLGESVQLQQERVLGPSDPDVMRTFANLGLFYKSAGQLENAIDAGQRAVVGYVRLFGEDHPDTLTARSNLASAFIEARRFDEAIELNDRVLEGQVRVLGSRHPSTLTSRANLATTYRLAGRGSDAIGVGEQVLVDHIDVLGEHHPFTLTSRASLALSYRSVGRTAEAIELLRAAIDQAAQLDHEHPHLASWRDELDSSTGE